MKSKFAVGAIIMLGTNDSGGEAEKVQVDLIEADSMEEALGKFFMPYLGKAAKIRDFSIKTDCHRHDTQMVEDLKNGKKINAIRRLREISGMGLKEAKDEVEINIIPELIKKGIIKDGVFSAPNEF